MSCYLMTEKKLVTIIKLIKKHNLLSDFDSLKAVKLYSDMYNVNVRSYCEHYVNSDERAKEVARLCKLYDNDAEKYYRDFSISFCKLYSKSGSEKKELQILVDLIQEFQYQSCDYHDYYKMPGYYKMNWVKDRLLVRLVGGRPCDGWTTEKLIDELEI